MISFSPVKPPACLVEFAATTPPPRFDGLAFQACKNQVRARLLPNQHRQCAYCEQPIDDNGDSCHLDHIESQVQNETRRFDITNLIAACQTQHTCGHRHGRESVPDELNPYLTRDLHNRIDCASDGELSSNTLSPPAEAFAFQQLNLNDPGLKSRREQIIVGLMQHTMSLSNNARRRLQNLSTDEIGFRSLHFKYLGRFGFPEP